jgi:hypothetical protein
MKEIFSKRVQSTRLLEKERLTLLADRRSFLKESAKHKSEMNFQGASLLEKEKLI